MAATSLKFGPEWMRNKQQTARSSSMPLPGTSPPTSSSTSIGLSSLSSYSSLLSSSAYESNKTTFSLPDDGGQAQIGTLNPFKYSKEEMLQVWRDGGGRGNLGLEVEQWEGVVKEVGGEPIGLRELTEGEKKLFSLPLNSELRRRQSHDLLPNTSERPKLAHSATTTLGNQRLGLLTRKKKEEGGDTGSALSIPRRLSLTSLASPLGTPLSPTSVGLSSPHTRIGSVSGSLDCSTEGWRKRELDPNQIGGTLAEEHGEQGGYVANSGPFAGSPEAYDSASVWSKAPSLPLSMRDEPGLSTSGVIDDLAMAVNALSALDEEKQHIEDSKRATDTMNIDKTIVNDGPYHGGFLPPRPSGLDNDPISVSWSYMDPKGNEQGPFSAFIMQKWYDEGYFTPELLMKRTYLDSSWTPMRELLLLSADNERLFFSAFTSVPPGLLPGPSLHNYMDRFDVPGLQNTEIFVNETSFRPSTSHVVPRDAYLEASSPHSSQSSTFNSPLVAQTASPDPAFRNSVFPTSVNGLDAQASLPLTPRPNVGFNDTLTPRPAALEHRNSVFSGRGYQGLSTAQSTSSSWCGDLTGEMNHDHDKLTVVNSGVFGTSTLAYDHLDGYSPDAYGTSTVTYPQNLASSEAFTQQTTPTEEPSSGSQHGRQTAGFRKNYSSGTAGVEMLTYAVPDHSTQEQRRPKDVQPQLPQDSSMRPVVHSTPHPRGPSDPPQPLMPSITPLDRSSLPQIGVETAESVKLQAEARGTAQGSNLSEKHQSHTAWNTLPPPSKHIESETRDIATSQPLSGIVPISNASGVGLPILASHSVVPSLKAAWATPNEDEKVAKTGLREIQEAEVKRAEAHKLTSRREREKDREKDRVAQVVYEEGQTFTTSWGLPTSQAGTATRIAPKEPLIIPPPVPPSGPVWANAAKQPPVVKRSMIEIQEEEESRKKVVATKEKDIASISSKRGYAESANKLAVFPPSGGAWTIVGAGGKPATRQLTTPPYLIRPNGAAVVRSSNTAHVSVSSPLSASQVSRSPPPPVKSLSAPGDDLGPLPPSPEFMKWLRDNMREFEPGFNTEDFMQMILSFSLDFPQPIIELIQEQVYANSKTMNGQRFAAEFVAKRRADAANRPKSGEKQPSLADVVKTLPKPVHADLPFKVVRKKGRAPR